MTTPDQAYEELLTLYRERSVLESISTTLGWDEETFMPEGALAHRAEQQALLARLEHERASDPRLAELLSIAERGDVEAGSARAVNLRELRRELDEARKTPASLVEALARATTMAEAAWSEARETGESAAYLPALARVVELTQAWADCVRDDTTRYDACLDEWETDLRETEVVALLGELTPRLVALADRIEARGPQHAGHALVRRVPVEAQRRLCLAAAEWLGFDLARGRLDEASHPSTMWLGPGDVRLTTRYDEERPFASFFATLHEVGHGLYDQRLPADHYGTPVGEAPSLALHESQARFVENVIGRSRGFVTFALPRIRAIAAPDLDDLDVDRLDRALHHVARSTHRISADEVTYDLHVGVRVALERALLSGDLRVADLEGAWSDAYARVLVRPATASDGFLQDGHWAAGMFGYFPTYTIGNVLAAQLAHAAATALGDLDARLARGEARVVVDWLEENVHRHGALFTRAELMTRIGGKPLDASAHVARLERIYGGA